MQPRAGLGAGGIALWRAGDVERPRPGDQAPAQHGAALLQGYRVQHRIDAGLGQVNLGYHAHRYTQPCELLDPYRNLAIAAEILREQHTPGEDWLLAIGRYHRPAGGAPAARYRRSVHRHLTRVLDPDVPVPTLQATTP